MRPELEELELTVAKGSFKDPVWVDLISGDVYDIDDTLWKANGEGCTFLRMPVYDAVVVVTERAAIGTLLPSD